MFAARITLPHFSVSSAMSLPKSAGESKSAVAPRSASRAFILGSARAALISLLSLSTISAGVSLAAPTPCHEAPDEQRRAVERAGGGHRSEVTGESAAQDMLKVAAI